MWGNRKGLRKQKNSKHNASKTIIDGHKFASAAEARQYVALRDDPDVINLHPHPPFVVVDAFLDSDGVTKHHEVKYTPDFRYERLSAPGKTFVMEVKGQMLPDAMIRIKLFRQRYPDLVFLLVDTKGNDWRQANKERQARKRLKKKQKAS